ncbi:MAG: BatA domain-containing protein [Planctomycetaceae bacterium]
MNFLQPWMLLALPLVALPIVIHLINQRRYQTIPWAAMMFLLAANRMSRGYARIRQWLILTMRTLAVAGLIFAISRPLLSGWLALTGRAESTLILLDRSPSMSQQASGTNASKRDSGLRQLSQILALIGSSRWVLVEGTQEQPRELDAVDDLPRLPETEPVA